MTPETKRHPRAVRLVATGSRLLIGAALATALVAGVVLAVPWGLPEIRREAARTAIIPDAADTTLVCTGPFRALGRNATDAWEMQEAAIGRMQVGSVGEPPTASELEVADLDDAAPVTVLSFPTDRPADAAQSFALRDPDLTGFAASPCRPPSMQAWIVGGAASVGTSDVLTISNPGDVASRVTLTTFGGAEGAPRTLVVPARSQLGVPLASTAVGQSAPVVHVSAEGAPVQVSLQSSLVRTLDPGGIDLQDSAGLPGELLVFAGVGAMGGEAEEEVLRLRLLSPEEDAQAQVRIRVAGQAAQAQEAQTIPLTAGVPVELGFTGLPAGTYGIEVEADAPVVGAVWQSTGIHPGSDFAWMTPAPAVSGSIVAAVPEGAAARMHLVNRGAAEARVVLRDLSDGTVREVVVPAEGSTLVPLQRANAYELRTDAEVHAAVSLYGTDLLAGWPLWPTAQLQEGVTVYR